MRWWVEASVDIDIIPNPGILGQLDHEDETSFEVQADNRDEAEEAALEELDEEYHIPVACWRIDRLEPLDES